ncbi:response regulator [Pelomonas sp. KK5]|uniref:hybrid sensor histidine kinase/response regulator n=1 Tax=Pelomonas sp. KK5 TaxID=1855730 RepID=UPI00097CB13A|nr:response regulator [Pelomonas sp. KK5]
MATGNKDPYRFFRIEAAELQDQISAGILALERADDAGTLSLLLRLTHTLKGAARVVKLADIAEHVHAMEDVLTALRDAGGAPTPEQIEGLLGLHDSIAASLVALNAAPAPPAVAVPAVPAAPVPAAVGDAGPTPPPVQAAQPALPAAHAPAPAATARADEGDMDSLLDAVSQAHRQLALLRRTLDQARRATGLAQTLASRLASETGAAAASNGKAGERRLLAQELSMMLAGFGQNYEASLYQMDRELDQVRDSAERLRLTPAARLFSPLQRAARDAGHALGKEVDFEGVGGDVRLDGEVLNLVQGALMQMVRNAVAHGIEPAAQRMATGKAARGRVSVRVSRLGRRVAFECTDDGAGMDLDTLRRKARDKGWVAPGAEHALDAQALLQFLLRGGLSTAATVNELAGRGVGLDVVRDASDRLGGEVKMSTEPGRGTTLSLIVPLRMAALEVLQVEAGGVPQSLPLDAVRRTLRLLPEDIAISAQGCSIAYEGRSVPYAALADALAHGGERADEGSKKNGHRSSAVIVQGSSGDAGDLGLAAIAVDRIVGTAYVTLRDPPELMPPHELLAGVSVDVEGRPQLVLDPDGLCAFARATLARSQVAEAQKLPILVIDDSLTTRMLEQSILESAGYTVHAAMSAEEGLEKARQQRYALFLVDVEMPGMDGFTFVERTRADPVLGKVPAVLITSLNSAADKQRGIDVGASGYIVKGEFAQSDFLQKVRQLVHGNA